MAGRRPWSTRALSTEGRTRRVEVKIAEGAQFDDIELAAAYRRTTVSGLMRSLAEDEVTGLDRNAPEWRTTAKRLLDDRTSPLRRGINDEEATAPADATD